jgi:Uncharacterized protein conserved in bacteria (DUF2252)
MQPEIDINAASRSYERWMHDCGPVVERHLQHKHAKMRQDPFQFFRGSYYRWAQTWAEACPDCADGLIVLAVGDLHVDSYGTWRDAEGRLCWGVDDFDESHPLPYTNDLIRLASSVKIARKLGLMSLRTRAACEIILEGYRQSLKNGGCPMVLAESETDLEKLGIEALKRPTGFWEKLNARPRYKGAVPQDAKHCLIAALPHKDLEYRIVQREAGLGSLGQQRFVAIAQCHGGYVAREAKRVVPSASTWLRGRIACHQWHCQKAMKSAVRSPDPYQRIWRSWLLRRLSPDSNPIKIEELSGKRDEDVLLHAMGSEAANVHLGTGRAKLLLRDLNKRKLNWLHSAARRMAKQTIRDWKEYRT